MAPGILVKPQPKFLQGISSSLPVVFIDLALCQQEITAVLIFFHIGSTNISVFCVCSFFQFIFIVPERKSLKM